MERLSADLQKISLLPHRESSAGSESPGLTSAERDAYLEQLKVFGRDPTNAEPIFTKEASCVLKNPPAYLTSTNRESKFSHAMPSTAHLEPPLEMLYGVLPMHSSLSQKRGRYSWT